MGRPRRAACSLRTPQLLTASLALLLAMSALAPLVARADFGSTVLQAEGEELVELLEDDKEAMESLLHWAIEHSDHEELARRAEQVHSAEMIEDLKLTLEERRARVRELRQYMDSQVTETQLMQECIAVLSRENATVVERLAALEDLQPLLEPIDNANDLKPLGGLRVLVQHLLGSTSAHPAALHGSTQEELDGLRAAAAYALGSAASNNVKFQMAVLESSPDLFVTLIELSLSPTEEVSVKGVYALAAMVRNLQSAFDSFLAAGGLGTLDRLVSSPEAPLRVKRKALSLVMDLSTLGGWLLSSHEELNQPGLLQTTLELLGSSDLDVVEKCLNTLKGLLSGPDSANVASALAQRGAELQLQELAARLAGVATQEREAGGEPEEEEDPFVAYLIESVQEVEQILLGAHKGTGSAPGHSRDTGDAGASPRGAAGDASRAGAARQGSAAAAGTGVEESEPLLQLGPTNGGSRDEL